MASVIPLSSRISWRKASLEIGSRTQHNTLAWSSPTEHWVGLQRVVKDGLPCVTVRLRIEGMPDSLRLTLHDGTRITSSGPPLLPQPGWQVWVGTHQATPV